MGKRGRLFGTDGVRGTANTDPMTAEMALQLGQAVAHVLQSKGGERRRIIIGKDTRLSGYLFEDALAAGICSMGVDVLQVGPMPTPAMAFLTARHALPRRRDDLGQPQPLSGQRHQVLQQRRLQARRRDRGPDREPDRIGRASFAARERGRHRARPPDRRCRGTLRRVPEEDLRSRPLARRPARGARLRERRGLQGRAHGARGAGRRGLPARRPSRTGATSTTAAARCIPRRRRPRCASCGPTSGSRSTATPIARCSCARRATSIDGDALLALCARDMSQRGTLRGGKVVATVMSNLGLERALGRLRRGARCARRWATATWSRRCAAAATTSAASSRGTSSSSTTTRPATA